MSKKRKNLIHSFIIIFTILGLFLVSNALYAQGVGVSSENYEFGKIMSSGNPKQKINFLFIANKYSEEEKQLFLGLVNETLFGKPNDNQLALFRDYLYKDETDKFNVYYHIKYDADYGGREEFLESLESYEQIYNDLNNIRDAGIEIKEEIDYFVIFTNDNGRAGTRFWADSSVSSYDDPVIGRATIILLFGGTDNSQKPAPRPTKTLAHELGHRIGGLGEEYYEETKGHFLPVLSKYPNVDSIGCPKWCSGNINRTTSCYGEYQKYLSCVENLTDTVTQRQKHLDCYQAYEPQLFECNFGIDCKLDTGCFWPAEGTLGFRPYYNSIMRSGEQYGQWHEKIIRENLADMETIKPTVSKIDISVEPVFNHTKQINEDARSVLYTFKIPFKIYHDDSQIPFIFQLNGRRYTVTFDVDVSRININQPISRAQLHFNNERDGYIAYFSLRKSAKENIELTDSDNFPVTLKVQYDDVIAEKDFIIYLKEGNVQEEVSRDEILGPKQKNLKSLYYFVPIGISILITILFLTLRKK